MDETPAVSPQSFSPSKDQENDSISSRPTRKRKSVLQEIDLDSENEVSSPVKGNDKSEDEDHIPDDEEASDSDGSDLPYTPSIKNKKTSSGSGRGSGSTPTIASLWDGTTSGRGTTARGRGTTPRGRGTTPRGRGTTPRGRGGRKSAGDFSTAASQNKFYKKLSGLDKNALINIIRVMIDSGNVTMSSVNSQIQSNVDIDSMVTELEKAKDAIFRAMPKPWRYGGGSENYQRNNFAFKRCTTSQNAFKTLLRAKTNDLKNLDDAETKIEFVLKTWHIVSELPQWIGCGYDVATKHIHMCLDMLAALLTQAIPKSSTDRLLEICDEVEEMTSFTGEKDIEVENEKMKKAFDLLKSKI